MNRRRMLSLVLTVLLLACSLAGPQSTQQAPTSQPAGSVTGTPAGSTPDSPTDVPTLLPSPTPTEIPALQIEDVLIVPDAPITPSDYLDFLDRRLAADEWTEEQGLVTLLRYAVGEEVADPFGGTPPQFGELGGLLALAGQYLADGTDETAKAEIARLVDILVPNIEHVLEYAQPEPKTSRLPQAFDFLASAPVVRGQAQNELCTDLAIRGYPPGSNVTCIQFTEATLTNGVGRVFYPIDWWPDDPRLVYATTAASAMVHSDQVFSQFGRTGSIDLVFGIVDKVTKETPPLAVQPFTPGETCQIVVYPLGVEESVKRENDIGYMEQIIAHETFHCMQKWNAQAFSPTVYDANKWWIEGSAEYFSNVAYPSHNFERSFVLQFNRHSGILPIPQMDYENTVFFQYLQNISSDAAVFNFLMAIPSSADPMVSITALAGWPDIENVFHNFARAWADTEIIDSGGGMLETQVVVSGITEVDGSSNLYSSSGQAFEISRSFWRFVPDKVFTINLSIEGPDGRDSARPAGIPLLWDSPPTEVRGGCGTTPYIIITTSTALPGDPDHEMYFDIHAEDDKECDTCLLGKWQLDAERFASDFNASLYEDQNIQYEPSQLSGGLVLSFTKGGIFQGIFDTLIIGTRILTPDANGNLFGLESVSQNTGQAYGTYRTDSTKLSVFTPISTVVLQMSLGASAGAPRELGGVGFGTGSDVPYTCSETELVFHTIDGATGEPFDYHYLRPPKP